MQFTLLIWESRPEEVATYLVPNDVITPRMREWMREAHGRMINVDDENDGMSFLNAALSPKEEYVDEGKWKDVACIFHAYKVVNEGPIEGNDGSISITHVYQSGFHL